MKIINTLFLCCLLAAGTSLQGCKSASRTQKGAVIGAAGGAAAGAIIGRAAGNTAMGAVIGATVGGATGAVIGNQMDKQAREIARNVEGVKVERVGEGIILEFSNKILFGFDKSDLSAQAKDNLSKLADILHKYPNTNIEIQGHTDSIGTEQYNQALSERRASAVAMHLRTKDIAIDRLTIKGFGESSPLYSNSTEEGRAKNRRVEFVITANEQMIEEAEREANKR